MESDAAPPPRVLNVGPDRLTVRRADVSELWHLRWRVLRAGLAFEEAKFEHDADPTTHHFGAFEEAGAAAPSTHSSAVGPPAVCCATFVLNAWEGEPAWQLRGMATDVRYRGRGVGGAVLAYAEACVTRDFPARLLWCNARVPALAFYQRQGWRIVSEQFDVPTAGPHRKMVKTLPA